MSATVGHATEWDHAKSLLLSYSGVEQPRGVVCCVEELYCTVGVSTARHDLGSQHDFHALLRAARILVVWFELP